MGLVRWIIAGRTRVRRCEVKAAATSLRRARITEYYMFWTGDFSHAGRSSRALRASAENQPPAYLTLLLSFRNGSYGPNVKDEPRPQLARSVLLGARSVTAVVV